MTDVNILFLGAGRRLSVAEAFLGVGAPERCNVRLFSIEDREQVAIAPLAKVLTAPSFDDPKFPDFLLATIFQHKISAVIPFMESAVLALSRIRSVLPCRAIVSASSLASTACDKSATEVFAKSMSVPTPPDDTFPKLIKPRYGYGSRGQYIAEDQPDADNFFRRHNAGDYVVQSVVTGAEYTVDAFVENGAVLGLLTRNRREVVAGEVDWSQATQHDQIEMLSRHILQVDGWDGPITLQFIDALPSPVLIEINARFGGGVTHAFHCGLDMPRWIVRRCLGRKNAKANPEYGSTMVRARRDVYL